MHRPVELHGHRGARGLRPENTLPGLAYALEIGVDALEFDVVLTADHQLVLSHDLTVSPITSRDTGSEQLVGRPINQLTLQQLRTLDVGCAARCARTTRSCGPRSAAPTPACPRWARCSGS